MNGIWTITYQGTEKSCAAWGLTARPVMKTRDRSPTEFSFRMAGAPPEAAIPIPFRGAVTIRQNRMASGSAFVDAGDAAAFVWQGYQTTQPGDVDGKSQGVTLTFKDVIWLLQNTTFQQLWTIASTPTEPDYISRCVLFMDINGWVPNVYQSVQWQINQIIAYAQLCGITIQAGTIDYSGWFLNYYHCRAVSCWDALLKCLEPIVDAKVWLDGSTNPPSLNVRTRANLAALAAPTKTAPGPITLPYKGVDATSRQHFSSKGFTPRYDLIPTQVVLQYQINNTFNGKPAPTWTNDVYPAVVAGQSSGIIPFAVVAPIDLTGSATVTETGTLDCEPLACVGGNQATKRAWWASKRGGEQDKLADFRVRFGANVIPDATVVDDNGNPIDLTQYPNRIVKGAYHAWMSQGATGIVAIRAHIKTKAQFAEWDVAGNTPAETDVNGNLIKKSNAHDLHIHPTLTNAPDGVTPFTGKQLTALAETPVANLAQNIFQSRAILDYDGSHEIIDRGLIGETIPLAQIIGHWNLLNFTGGAVAWLTANMTIAGSEIDLMTNHIRIEVGPSKHLQPQDWNSMLQFFRYRRLYMQSSVRATGMGDANSNVDMAINTPDGNSVEGLAVDSAHSLITYQTPADPTSTLQAQSNLDTGIHAAILAATTPTPFTGFSAADVKIMQPREVQVCDANGNPFFMIVHASGGYTKS